MIKLTLKETENSKTNVYKVKPYIERYRYKGPIFDRFDNFIDNVNIVSEGPSREKVISQIKWRLGNEYHKKIFIDESKLEMINLYNKDFENNNNENSCEICGRHLTTSGECPVCDLGERAEDID